MKVKGNRTRIGQDKEDGKNREESRIVKEKGKKGGGGGGGEGGRRRGVGG